MMAGIQQTYVTMTTSQRDALLENVRLAQATADQARKRSLAQEQARIQAEARIEELENTIQKAEKRTAAAFNTMAGKMRGYHAASLHASQQQQDQLTEQIKKCHEAIRVQSQQTKKVIEQTRDETQREMNLQRESLIRELTAQRTRFENELAISRKAIDDAISNITVMEETTGKHHKHALYWIEQTNGLVTDIMQFRHELFAPNELRKIQDEIVNAGQDMQMQAFQSAIATGRTAFQKASDLKIRIINAENEWNQVFHLWQRELALVSADFTESTEQIYEIDTTEGRERIAASLDYWTNGKLIIAQFHLQELKTKMSDIDSLLTETLHQGLHELDRIRDELSIIQKIGRENLMLSHARYVQACFFADILSDNFAMTDSQGDYEGNEPSNSYIGIYRNPSTKDAIVVKIQPIPDTTGIVSSDRLEVHYFTASNNEEQRHQWTKIIEDELNKQGLTVGTFTTRKGYEDRPSDQFQMTDIEWIRQNQVTK